ncbi:MAG: hypothetical protein ABSB35_22520 [Bryobacteraceae bacterium]|jgi:hypothetical protein
MHKHLTLVFATLALSVAAFAQFQDNGYQIGYAANLNIGDSEINISNDGFRAGFYPNALGAGNICANVYVFDPQEEEVACCSCLVTPNGLVSLSAKNDLISDVLTPAIPTSIVVKVTATVPGTSTGTNYNVCNPTLAATVTPGPQALQEGLLVWGVTLEPSQSAGTYGPVNVPFINGTANLTVPATGVGAGGEIAELSTVCAFVQQEGTGFGVCKSCVLGALGGNKN